MLSLFISISFLCIKYYTKVIKSRESEKFISRDAQMISDKAAASIVSCGSQRESRARLCGRGGRQKIIFIFHQIAKIADELFLPLGIQLTKQIRQDFAIRQFLQFGRRRKFQTCEGIHRGAQVNGNPCQNGDGWTLGTALISIVFRDGHTEKFNEIICAAATRFALFSETTTVPLPRWEIDRFCRRVADDNIISCGTEKLGKSYDHIKIRLTTARFPPADGRLSHVEILCKRLLRLIAMSFAEFMYTKSESVLLFFHNNHLLRYLSTKCV